MPDLGGDAEAPAQQLAVENDSAADPRPDCKNYDVVLAAAGAEPRLPPGRRVGVVLHDGREPEALLERCPERRLTPGEVGREQHHRAQRVHEPGRADADRADFVGGGQLAHGVGDRILDPADIL